MTPADGAGRSLMATATFPPRAETPRDVRRWLHSMFDVWALDATLGDEAQLAADELVTNAVVHAASDITVHVERQDAVVRVEIHDESTRMPAPRAVDEHATGGRGLRIVDAVSTRWGTDAQGDGKTVWFEIDESSFG